MVLDERAQKLAQTVVNYSTDTQPNDVIRIAAELYFEEFAGMIAECAEEKGAEVLFDFYTLEEHKGLIDRNNEEELKKESKRLSDLMERITANVVVYSKTDPFYLEGIDPEKIADYNSIVKKPYFERLLGNGKNFKGKKWNVVPFPCEAEAKKAGMGLEEFADLIYGATNIDWTKAKEEMEEVKKAFDFAEEVRVHVPGMTDLTFSLKDRGAMICDGKHNMPDGEVFYSPIEDSANGYIYFHYPTVRDGNLVEGIRLEFKNGEVVSFKAEKNQEFLEAMLKLEGAKRIGEFGIGCNYGIEKYTKNLLFDEKLGGTIHLALGFSIEVLPLDKGGGLNKSDIHWDLVCELRKINKKLPGGMIYVNDKLVQENGSWVF